MFERASAIPSVSHDYILGVPEYTRVIGGDNDLAYCPECKMVFKWNDNKPDVVNIVDGLG